jgi:hypothetical protein
MDTSAVALKNKCNHENAKTQRKPPGRIYLGADEDIAWQVVPGPVEPVTSRSCTSIRHSSFI